MGWTTTTIRPIGARILVKLDEQADNYGSIYLPEDVRRQQQTGVVVAVGSGLYDERGRFHGLGVEVGERVVFGKYNGLPMPDPEDDYSGKPTPRYYMLEQEPHKKQHTHKIPDCYGVLEDAPALITEWRKV